MPYFSKAALTHIVLLGLPSKLYDSRLARLDQHLHRVDIDGVQLDFQKDWGCFLRYAQGHYKLEIGLSAIVLSFIPAAMQISSMNNSPITAMFGYLAFVSALYSMLPSIAYLVQLSDLKEEHTGRAWVQDAARLTGALNDPATLMTVPLIWLLWSILYTFAFILSAIWIGLWQSTNGDITTNATEKGSTTLALTVCITVTVWVGLGAVHTIYSVRGFYRIGNI